ncbi:MAG: succinate dehydrogenase, hydrophobic membrane anchor protein, partial [Pseudomonadota bacterium]
GSAKDGTEHFWGQRLSGIALAILGVWFAICAAQMPGFSYAETLAFIGDPLNGVLLTLLVVTVGYHSYLGVQTVIEDYVHSHGLKLGSLILVRFAHILLAVAGVYGILKIGLAA